MRGGPVEALARGDVEKRGAKDVLWRVPVAAGVAVAGEGAAHVVLPQARLVAAERPQPHRVAQDHQPTGPGHAQHLFSHIPRMRDMFGHVGGVGDVEGGVGKGQLRAVAAHRVGQLDSRGRHLARIGLNAKVARPAPSEGLREVAWPAAHIEHARAGKGDAEVGAEGVDKQGGVGG